MVLLKTFGQGLQLQKTMLILLSNEEKTWVQLQTKNSLLVGYAQVGQILGQLTALLGLVPKPRFE